MKLKIITANIAFGRPHMNNLLTNVFAHFVFHGRQMITLFTNPIALKGRAGYLDQNRVNYLKRHSSLKNIISLIEKEQPDVIMLNELILQLHKDEIETTLRGLGYKSFAWGLSEHYLDTTVSSFVASKFPGEAVTINFPQESHAGGGGGIATLRLSEAKITLIAVHMCVSDKFAWLYDAEVENISKFILEEKSQGREVIIAGDFNASTPFLQKYSSFSKLNLKNADNDMPTCPTFFKKLRPLDHIFVPQNYKVSAVKTIFFSSDHLAVSSTIELN